jgi:hypothetical protein
MMMFNQCRLRDALGWHRVSWVPTPTATPGRAIQLPVARLGLREYIVQTVYPPSLPESIFTAARPNKTGALK